MRLVSFISTGVLLLLGALAPSYAQLEQHEQDAKPPAQDQQAKPEKRQQDKNKQPQGKKQQPQRAQQQKNNQNRQQQQRAQEQQGQNRQQPQRAQQQQANRQSQQVQRVQRGQEREVWQQHRARNWQSEHRDWQQRGGYDGYRIPDMRYRSYFGPSHRFRIYRYPMELYGGYPRFRYGGFWFGLMDPWPEYWSADWYDNDDVYIVYTDGGYYLYNRRYPRDRIAITVYLN